MLSLAGVGFQPTDMETKGKCLLSTLSDALWVIDGHLETLVNGRYSEFSDFSNYNVPEASKHKQKILECTAVEVNAHKQGSFRVGREGALPPLLEVGCPSLRVTTIHTRNTCTSKRFKQ